MEPAREIQLFDLQPREADFLSDVVSGLMRAPKRLPSMYFYDERGSLLFDKICDLKEYYPTRTELSILKRHAADIARRLGSNCQLIELGSGSSLKTHLLLRALTEPHSYVPVDISRVHLLHAAARVAHAFPQLPVTPVCADFTAELRIPTTLAAPAKKVVWFPGSTIGNFEPAERRTLLQRIRKLCLPQGGGLLIGIDLKKDRRRLESAYNDASGVTAQFNLNLLQRINRELSADFRLEAFAHHAMYNAACDRIEMHLVSRCEQRVAVGGESVRFREGETICTEYSYKFSVEEFAALAADFELHLEASWTDPENLFAVLLLVSR
ncbi:MAG: hypothetical protein RJA70_2306 [Pseudomonadota bacterium]|jgi:dimethylhistidine N-methyltransferase